MNLNVLDILVLVLGGITVSVILAVIVLVRDPGRHE
jgi:hypothetical protein